MHEVKGKQRRYSSISQCPGSIKEIAIFADGLFEYGQRPHINSELATKFALEYANYEAGDRSAADTLRMKRAEKDYVDWKVDVERGRMTQENYEIQFDGAHEDYHSDDKIEVRAAEARVLAQKEIDNLKRIIVEAVGKSR